MKQLANKPFLLSLILALALWFALDNFVIALALGLLLGFMISMLRALYVVKHHTPAEPSVPMPSEPVAPSKSPAVPSGLPTLDDASAAHNEKVVAALRKRIEQSPNGFLPFEEYMDVALYAPGLGYYAAGNTKFPDPEGHAGDFTTAPEMTPLFGRALARQVAQILDRSNSRQVLEFGAGSGALAASLIPALREMGIEPVYTIVELSADLRQRQKTRLAGLGAMVTWLDHLPGLFEGCVLANEVLDAMPVTAFRWDEQGRLMEKGVGAGEPFSWLERPAAPGLQDTVLQRMPALPGYASEINVRAEAWVRNLGEWLNKGAALLIDYGFPQREYYHPQRAQGTLMCHFRHHAHAEPLVLAGVQDITAHVDFTAMADAALEGGLDVLGYTSQARFLMNIGLLDCLAETQSADPLEQSRLMAPVQKLLAESEMGELFKVLAVGKDIEPGLLGFTQGDRRDRL